MSSRNERAAAMRQTWLGDAAGEAVAWDELKQCVRDRWLAALDAAQPESAALAAVGPQYCPADVGFGSRVPELERELAEARAELAQAEIELAGRAFYVREFAAVSQERDGLKKRNDVQAEQLIRIDREISPLMSEVAELKAELAELKAQPGGWELDVTAEEAYHVWHNGPNKDLTDVLDLCRARIRPAAPCAELAGVEAELESLKMALVEAKQQRDIVASKLITHGVSVRDLYAQGDGNPFGGWHFEDGGIVPNDRPVAPRAYTDADIDALARVLCDAAYRSFGFENWEETGEQEGYRLAARAALDWMGAPVGECKECEKWEAKYKDMKRWHDRLDGMVDAARAALEGE